MATQLTAVTTGTGTGAAAAPVRKPQHNSAEEEGLLPAENPVEDLRQAAASPIARPVSALDAAQPSALSYLWTNHRSMVLVFLVSTLCFFLFMSSTKPFGYSSSGASTLELAEWKAYRARMQIADKEREAEAEREQALKELMQQEKEGRLAPADAAFPDKDGQHYARLYAKAVAAHAEARKRRHAAQHQSRDPHTHVHETEEHDSDSEADDRALRKRPSTKGTKDAMVQIVFPKEDDEPGSEGGGAAVVDASPATIVPQLTDADAEAEADVVLVSPASKVKEGLTRANTAQSPLTGGQVNAAEVSALPTKRPPMVRPPPVAPTKAAGSSKKPATQASSNLVQQARRDRSPSAAATKPAQSATATKPSKGNAAASANAGKPSGPASLKPPPTAAPASAAKAPAAKTAAAAKSKPARAAVAIDESKPTPHLVRAIPTGPTLPQTRENMLASLPSVIKAKSKPPPPPSRPEMPRTKPL